MAEDPEQRKKSGYVQALRLPWLPEWLTPRDGYAALAKAFAGAARPDAFDLDALAAYRTAWAQPGALTGSVNWYRALFLQDLPVPPHRGLQTPMLILWGDRDPFGGPELAEASARLCSDVRVRHFADATHWIAHDNPRVVSAALIEFLKEDKSAAGFRSEPTDWSSSTARTTSSSLLRAMSAQRKINSASLAKVSFVLLHWSRWSGACGWMGARRW